MKICKKGEDWLIVLPEDSKEDWWESEAWIKTKTGWECRSCIGGKPRATEEELNKLMEEK